MKTDEYIELSQKCNDLHAYCNALVSALSLTLQMLALPEKVTPKILQKRLRLELMPAGGSHQYLYQQLAENLLGFLDANPETIGERVVELWPSTKETDEVQRDQSHFE